MAPTRNQAPICYRKAIPAAAQKRHQSGTRRPATGDCTPRRRDQRTPGLSPLSMPTPMQTHQQTIHDLTSTEGPVPLTLLTQKSAVLCTQPPAGEHHTKKADDARQKPKRLQRQNTHTRATRHPRLLTPPHHALDLLRTACAPTSAHSNGFCAIWVCISTSPSSSSDLKLCESWSVCGVCLASCSWLRQGDMKSLYGASLRFS